MSFWYCTLELESDNENLLKRKEVIQTDCSANIITMASLPSPKNNQTEQ